MSSKTISKRIYIQEPKKGKSLKKEFDLIINKYYYMLSTQEIEMVWHTIGTQLAHNSSHIGSLKNLIKDSIRLTNHSK